MALNRPIFRKYRFGGRSLTFDFEGDLTKKQIKKLRKASSLFVKDEFTPALESALEKYGLNNLCSVKPEPDGEGDSTYPEPRKIFVSYKSVWPDGISVVFKDFRKHTGGFSYVYKKDGVSVEVQRKNPGDHIISLSPYDEPIIKEINDVVESEANQFAFLNASIFPRSLFSIESDFVERNPEKVRPYNEDSTFDETTEIKLLTNDKAGKAGRARWYIANRDVITTGLGVLNDWKVIVSSANAGGQKRDNQIEVIGPNCAFGRARIALRTFKTREEAYNFLKWCKTDLIRFAFLLTDESLSSLGKQVPDICNYANNNGVIEFSFPDINQQVYNLFKITSEQQIHIKEVLRELDNKRNKKIRKQS